MAGAIPHIVIGLISAIAIHFMHFRYEFSMAVFLGNLLPDAIKFGVSTIVQGTFLFFKIEQDALYWAMAEVTSSFGYWITMLVFTIALTSVLWDHKYVKKREMKEINEIWGFLVIGIITHLIMDTFILEGNWIL